MKLLKDAMPKDLPKLGETEHDPDPWLRVRLHFPGFYWTWYVIEFDGDDECYCLVAGYFPMFGRFRLSELAQMFVRDGVAIEPDPSFRPCRFSEVMQQLQAPQIEPAGSERR